MATAQAELDPITLSVMGGAFKAIAKQMAQVLYRMSYSSIIRESEDLGCGIFFADGAELCESDTTPMHVGSIPGYLEGIISVVGDDIHDGTSSSTTTPTWAPRTRPTCASRSRSSTTASSARGPAPTATWPTWAACRRA